MRLKDIPDYSETVNTLRAIGNEDTRIEPRPLDLIARDIRKHWQNVNYAAESYLQAMFQLTHITDRRK